MFNLIYFSSVNGLEIALFNVTHRVKPSETKERSLFAIKYIRTDRCYPPYTRLAVDLFFVRAFRQSQSLDEPCITSRR